MSTIRNANNIFVLSEGKVVEQGNHQELMLKKSAYYNLVMTQVSAHGFSESDEDGKEAVQMFDDKKASIIEEDFEVRL